MWISKKKFDALVARVDELETCQRKASDDASMQATFMVYKDYGSNFPTWRPRSKTITVKEVVESILYRLGMELKYVDGTPERVAVQDVKKVKK